MRTAFCGCCAVGQCELLAVLTHGRADLRVAPAAVCPNTPGQCAQRHKHQQPHRWRHLAA